MLERASADSRALGEDANSRSQEILSQAQERAQSIIDDAQQSAAELMSNASNYVSDAHNTVEQLLAEAKSTSQQMLDNARETATADSRELIENATRQARAIQSAATEYRDHAIAAVAHHRGILQELTERITALREQWAQSHIAITEQVARAGTHFAQAENKATELVSVLNERQEELSNSLSGIGSGIALGESDFDSRSEQTD